MSFIKDQQSKTSVANAGFPTVRLRRLRQNPAIRKLVREHVISLGDLILPLFIKSGQNIRQPIASMPGHYQWSLDRLDEEIESIVALNIPGVILFGIPEKKDAIGSESISPNGIIQNAVRLIKAKAPQLLVIVDVCLCEYTDHGHCGVLLEYPGSNCDVENDSTLMIYGQQAVSLAAAGADIVAPSGMMDGMVSSIRGSLDQAGFHHIPIMSYSIKYASAFYGPFREAAEGTPKFGDRSSYQMDPADGARALREAELDVSEGADILMVKPAQNYLDIIYRTKQRFPSMPLAAYQVSGEYSMICAAAEKGWLDKHKAMMESLLAIKRSGADFIISYFAKEYAAYFAN